MNWKNIGTFVEAWHHAVGMGKREIAIDLDNRRVVLMLTIGPRYEHQFVSMDDLDGTDGVIKFVAKTIASRMKAKLRGGFPPCHYGDL